MPNGDDSLYEIKEFIPVKRQKTIKSQNRKANFTPL